MGNICKDASSAGMPFLCLYEPRDRGIIMPAGIRFYEACTAWKMILHPNQDGFDFVHRIEQDSQELIQQL